jgi:hypothetical protein
MVKKIDENKKKKKKKQGDDHDGTRTHNLPLRRRAPYPLGHAVADGKAR